MTFSLSTLCTHFVLCGVLLLLMSALMYASPCLDKPGRIWVMTGSVMLAVRMLLPFEWKATKTIYISQIYPEVTYFFNRTVQLPYLPACPLYMVLLCFLMLISAVRLACLVLTQYRYRRYLRSLPVTEAFTIVNRLGWTKKVCCITDPYASNALAIGLFKPQIVLPALSFTEQERSLVLRHELAHIASGDIALKLFMEIISAVYWWIPFIGALSKQTNAALELHADDLVTKELDESQRLEYLSCLLKVAKCSRRTPSPFAIGLMTGKECSLKTRFRYVLERPRTSPLFHAVALLCIVMMALSFFVVFEPYHIPDDVLAETFSPKDEGAYLVLREDGGYDLYVKEAYMGMLISIPEEIQSLPIKKYMEERP